MRPSLLILLSLLICFNFSLAQIECSDNPIEHCDQCGSGNEADSCSLCEDKYFPILGGKLCIPCNDPIFGNVACEGKCSPNLNYIQESKNLFEPEEVKFSFCEEKGCKEGTFNENGTCRNCSEYDPGCSKCTYSYEDNNENFVCLECKTNDDYTYFLLNNGICDECYMDNCYTCHYLYDDPLEKECEKCEYDYYKDENGTCQPCYIDIPGGLCFICDDLGVKKDIYDENTCSCDNGYYKEGNGTCQPCYVDIPGGLCSFCDEFGVKKDIYDENTTCTCNEDYIKAGNNTCVKKPENCEEYEFNSETNIYECLKCEEDYYINQDKECSYCDLSQFSYSGDGCLSCTYHKETFETICAECGHAFVLNEKDGYKCIKCQDDCLNCTINEVTNEALCEACDDNFYLNPNDKTCYQCDRNCEKCSFNSETSQPECEVCHEGYILNSINKKCVICRSPCKNCSFNSETGESECETCFSKYALNNADKTCEYCGDDCEKCSFNSETGELECEICAPNYAFNSTDKLCKYCGEGCGKCSFNSETGEPECEACTSKYAFNSTDKTCKYCGDVCEKCSFNSENGEPECEACTSNYILNSNKKICEKCEDNCNECIFNSETGENESVTCKDDYVLNLKDKKCYSCDFRCKNCSYDPTAEEVLCISCHDDYWTPNKTTCIWCENESCESCKYDSETDEFLCLTCPSFADSGIYFVLYNGFCYDCPDDCSECEYDENSEDENKLICKVCINDKVLNESKQCSNCNEIKELGDGCSSCGYNEIENKYECYSCIDDVDEYYENNYIYLNETLQCVRNDNKSEIYLYGCKNAIFNYTTKKYECIECKYYFYLLNDKTCRIYDDIGHSNCMNVINIQTPEDPIYTCEECAWISIPILNETTNAITCIYDSNLTLCEKGKFDKNGKIICLNCSENSETNKEGICKCNSDYFYNDEQESCYKCDDENYNGNPGCAPSKGCTFNGMEVICNECKEGYFQLPIGVNSTEYSDLSSQSCIPCYRFIDGCNQCHYDEKDDNIKCDACYSNYFIENETEGQCILNDCQEYPEISSGCIICKDKLNEYLPNKKCQSCKYGYFKTKEETCIYCRSEKYGGPGCYNCGYEEDENGEETDNIICKNCFNNENDISTINWDFDRFYGSVLTSEGKCYNCKYNLSDNCLKCDMINNKLGCTLCKPGYYLDNELNCISYVDQIKTIPNCHSYDFTIKNIHFWYNSDSPNKINLDDYNFDQFLNNFSLTYDDIKNSPINTQCDVCDDNYISNDEGECDELKIDMCTGEFIINKGDTAKTLLYSCESFCSFDKSFPMIYIKLVNDTIDYNISNYFNYIEDDDSIRSLYGILDFYQFFYQYYINDTNEETKQFILNTPICLDLSTDQLKQDFENCEEVLYIPTNKSYKCIYCSYGFTFDENNISCIKKEEPEPIIDLDCDYENIGTDSSPIYSCISCYYPGDTLVTLEDGTKRCIDDNINCTEAEISTVYLQPLYNCIACKDYYLPFYNKYYGRKICQNVFDEIIYSKNISLLDYSYEDNITIKEDGTCIKNYFTIDGNYCYKCDNKYNGMPGCNGECSYSLDRYNSLLCESICKDGYIESSQGICEPCDKYNKGCFECHYEETKNYSLDGRYRNLVCEYCENGYKLIDGKCISCEELTGSSYCQKCEKDNDTEIYSCTQCDNNAVLSEGVCHLCLILGVKQDNECIYCSDPVKGIENCNYCINDENDAIQCKECDDGYILSSDENKCLNRKDSKFEQMDNCMELKTENGNYICSRCKPEFTVLNGKCIYQPLLFDKNYLNYYYNNIYLNYLDHNIQQYDYNYKYSYYFPCKESVNVGTEENPLYSCSKCYNIFDDENLDNIYYDEKLQIFEEFEYKEHGFPSAKRPLKILDVNNNGYCIQNIDDIGNGLENCTEAIYEILPNGIEIYNCTKCLENNELTFIPEMNISVCLYNLITSDTCLVKYCESCVENNNFECEKCISPDYEVNPISGACVKKTTYIPSITWKDVYKYNINNKMLLNGRNITGPYLKLRGITSSQISKNHAFLIYSIFESKTEPSGAELLKIPTICKVNSDLEKVYDDINIVDYECIGKEKVDQNNYKLIGIEDGDNDEIISNGNIKGINEIIIKNGDNLSNKKVSDYKEWVNENIMIADINDDNNNYNSLKNIFNFSLSGQLKNKEDIPIGCYKGQVEIKGYEDEIITTFCFDEKNNFIFNFFLELKNETNNKIIYFSSSEITILKGEQIKNDIKVYIPGLEQIRLNYTEDIPQPEPEISDDQKNSTEPSGSSPQSSGSSSKPSESSVPEGCFVENCNTCISGNSFFCEECISSDYEVSKISGSCIEKIEEIPSVTWKDVFNLNMRKTKKRNGKTITGPSLTLRGITSSEVPKNHEFSIYLVFTVIGLRNLEENTIKIPAICEAEQGTEKSDSSSSIIDYECLGNTTVDSSKYVFSGIEEVNDNANTLSSDLNVINTVISEKKDLTKEESSYTKDNIPPSFKIKDFNIRNYTRSDGIFNITINLDKGDFNNKVVPEGCNNAEVKITEIKDEPKAEFCFDSKDNTGVFKFLLELKKETENKIIEFKSDSIYISKNRIRNLDDDDKYEINIPRLNLIKLNYEKDKSSPSGEGGEEEEEEKPEKTRYNRKNNSGSNGWKIALAIIAGVIALIAIAVTIICLKKSSTKNNNINYGSTIENMTNDTNEIIHKIS